MLTGRRYALTALFAFLAFVCLIGSRGLAGDLRQPLRMVCGAWGTKPGQFGLEDTLDGGYTVPGPFAVGPGDRVTVWDDANSRLQVFSPAGKLLSVCPLDAYVEHLGVGRAPAGPDQRTRDETCLYLTDGFEERIGVFARGKVRWYPKGSLDKHASGLAVDARTGRLAMEYGRYRPHRHDPRSEGSLIGTWTRVLAAPGSRVPSVDLEMREPCFHPDGRLVGVTGYGESGTADDGAMIIQFLDPKAGWRRQHTAKIRVETDTIPPRLVGVDKESNLYVFADDSEMDGEGMTQGPYRVLRFTPDGKLAGVRSLTPLIDFRDPLASMDEGNVHIGPNGEVYVGVSSRKAGYRVFRLPRP